MESANGSAEREGFGDDLQVRVDDLNTLLSALSELSGRFDAAITPCSIGLIEARLGLARATSALRDEVDCACASVVNGSGRAALDPAPCGDNSCVEALGK